MYNVSTQDLEDFDSGWADPRVGALIQRAEEFGLAGDHATAVETLDEAIRVPGVDAAYAMAERAASLFELGRQADARSQLEALRKHKSFSIIAFHRAAEAAEAAGDLHLALRWFDMALSRSADQIASGEQSEADMGGSFALLVLGRRRVRASLELPADDLDRAGDPHTPERPVAYSGGLPPGVVEPNTVVRVLFWPLDEIPIGAARWPKMMEHDLESAPRQRELENRRLAEEGARVMMVPLTVAALEEYAARTNEDPLDPRVRTKLLHRRYDQGLGVAWPPARNARCWCGSHQKYKKCCGAPSTP